MKRGLPIFFGNCDFFGDCFNWCTQLRNFQTITHDSIKNDIVILSQLRVARRAAEASNPRSCDNITIYYILELLLL